MIKCSHITKKRVRCGRSASHKINCKLLCWQHAKFYNVFTQKGEFCNYKLLQRFDTLRKPFLGLGVSGKVSGISGSVSVPSIFKIFNVMYEQNTCFIDIGAADGYMLIMALLYGYKSSSGIEYQKSNSGLQDIFNTLWQRIKDSRIGTGMLSHQWFGNKPIINYNIDISTMRSSINSLSLLGRDIHIFTFWDGFSPKDSLALLLKLRGQNIKKGCFISRKSRTFGTFEKLQNKCLDLNINIVHIKSIKVAYRTDKYNAIIVRFI